MLRHVGDARAPIVRRERAQRYTVAHDFAARRFDESQQQADHCAFPRAGVSHQRDAFPACDGERNARERGACVVVRIVNIVEADVTGARGSLTGISGRRASVAGRCEDFE